MRLTQYIHERGLYPAHVASKMGVTRQCFEQYDRGVHSPTLKSLTKIAAAMTELGALTTVADLSTALLKKEEV